MELKFDWNDITIVPATMADIDSRGEIDTTLFTENEIKMLPLFAAPMDTVIGLDNQDDFYKNGINICLPRGTSFSDSNTHLFYSYGLDEIIEIVNEDRILPKRVLIDVANAHMKKLYDISKKIKEQYDYVELMVGNIANPETYRLYCEIGVDWIRCGIGAGCFTTKSLVMTDTGLKEIIDIEIGDKVLTHKNQYKEVLHKFEFEKNEKLLRINNIECTKNHEFYVIDIEDQYIADKNNIDDYAFWISAKNLDRNKHLMIKY